MEFDPQEKPDWLPKLPDIDLEVIDEPISEIANFLLGKLKLIKGPIEEFQLITYGLLVSNFEAYKSVKLLLKKETRFPAQAHILTRSMLDSVFNFLLLCDNPEKYSTQYIQAGYRANYEEYVKLNDRYGEEPGLKHYLEWKWKYLGCFRDTFHITAESIEDAKKLPYWPIPSQMLRENNKLFSDPERLRFAKELYTWEYSLPSEMSHQAWIGLVMNLFSKEPEYHWDPGMYESNIFILAALFLVMILSETEAHLRIADVTKLRYSWGILSEIDKKAKGYYEFRYRSLLKDYL